MPIGLVGKPERPLRVAIVGSGPAGFYAADFVLRGQVPDTTETLVTEVDMFERLPTPYGLVRSGVAPDHQSIKKVTKAFERIAKHERFRFFGNINVGRDISHSHLLQNYDQVLYAVGSATDRRLGVSGEDLRGSYAATAFVGWYNGHPDFRELDIDLSSERAVVVGLGNVAMDVARLLVRDPEELKDTDIAGYALDALRRSRVREVVLLGRRGAAQAAFTPREIKDIAELAGVTLSVDGDPSDLPALEGLEGAARQNVEFLRQVAEAPQQDSPRRVRLRFLSSPVEILGQDDRVTGVKVERNELVESGDGRVNARGTGDYEILEAGLVFRSIGYKGTALEGIPFDECAGTIPNDEGRVLQCPGGARFPHTYAVGWIKRGPSGLIGTNKADAKETAEHMLRDAFATRDDGKQLPANSAIVERLTANGLRIVTMNDWFALDALETENGKSSGKVREKFYSAEDMLAALR